jgi:sn-glycerol 3-phosphate transport system substrate-binding protein
MIENYGAWHDLPFATKANGFGGTDIELKFNDQPRIKHIQRLADWGKDKRFVYGGREGKSDSLFNGGECAFRVGSSGSAAGAEKALGQANVGIGMMPYDPSVRAKPQNSIIGGATLWVLQGRPKAEYAGVAKFMTYLSSTPVQAKWHQDTGYVPITLAAAKATEEAGFYKKFPGRDVAVKQLTLNPPTDNSKGLRIGNFVQIRDVVDEELESVWSGKKDAKTALDEAVKRGNDLLRKFEAANK